jgi:hypothetical protein
MSPFVKDIDNDYFQMLQTIYVKHVALYYESMPSFKCFLAQLQFILFYFEFVSTKYSFQS